jgi:hypothetical protein
MLSLSKHEVDTRGKRQRVDRYWMTILGAALAPPPIAA